MKNYKDRYKDLYSNIKMDNETENKILAKTVKRNKFNIKFKKVVFASSMVMAISLVSVGIVYAQEIKDMVNNVIYKYISREDQSDLLEYGVNEDANGVQIVQVTEKLTINNIDSDKIFNSYEEVRKELGIPLLKVPDILTQFRILSVTDEPWLEEIIKKPRIVYIDLSNHMTYNCEREKAYDETPNKCQEEHKESNKTNHYLDLKISFLTQYATDEDKEKFMAILGDFPSRPTSSYESKKHKTTVYTEGNISYVFVKDNIIYSFKNYANSYTPEQMKDMIENMNY